MKILDAYIYITDYNQLNFNYNLNQIHKIWKRSLISRSNRRSCSFSSHSWLVEEVEKFHHSGRKQPRPRLTSANDSFLFENSSERVDRRLSSFQRILAIFIQGDSPGFSLSRTRGISPIFPLISDKETLDSPSIPASQDLPVSSVQLTVTLSLSFLPLWCSFRHRFRATRTRIQRRWIEGYTRVIQSLGSTEGRRGFAGLATPPLSFLPFSTDLRREIRD